MQISDPNGPQRDLLDGAAVLADAHSVADDELILEQDEEAGDQILDEALRTERHRKAENPDARQEGSDIDKEVEARQEDGQDDDRSPDTADQLGNGLPALLPG